MKINATQLLLAALVATQVPTALRELTAYDSEFEAYTACVRWEKGSEAAFQTPGYRSCGRAFGGAWVGYENDRNGDRKLRGVYRY